MKTYFTEATVLPESKIALDHLPFGEGQDVAVFMMAIKKERAIPRRPNLPVRSFLMRRLSVRRRMSGKRTLDPARYAYLGWYSSGSDSLSTEKRAQLELHPKAVSAISCWEVAKLVERGRLHLTISVNDWITQGLGPSGITLLPLEPEVAVLSRLWRRAKCARLSPL